MYYLSWFHIIPSLNIFFFFQFLRLKRVGKQLYLLILLSDQNPNFLHFLPRNQTLLISQGSSKSHLFHEACPDWFNHKKILPLPHFIWNSIYWVFCGCLISFHISWSIQRSDQQQILHEWVSEAGVWGRRTQWEVKWRRWSFVWIWGRRRTLSYGGQRRQWWGGIRGDFRVQDQEGDTLWWIWLPSWNRSIPFWTQWEKRDSRKHTRLHLNSTGKRFQNLHSSPAGCLLPWLDFHLFVFTLFTAGEVSNICYVTFTKKAEKESEMVNWRNCPGRIFNISDIQRPLQFPPPQTCVFGGWGCWNQNSKLSGLQQCCEFQIYFKKLN